MALLHHIRFGAGEPALVFVHGFACSHTDWAAQVPYFAPTRTVLACDLRGHGATPGRAEECTLENYGADVAALVSALALRRAVLVGHSMGCRVVLEAARAAPDSVAGLVLVDGSRIGTGDPAAAAASAKAAIDAAGFARFANGLFEGMFLPSSPAAMKRAAVERAAALPAAVGAALFPRMCAWDAGRMETALEAVRVPVLVIQSSFLNAERVRVPLEPGQTTPWLDLVRARVPAAKIEIVSGVGHFPQMEAADKVNTLIEDFLRAL